MKPVLFYDPAFPYEGPAIEVSVLERLSETFTIADADSLAAQLSQAASTCYVHLHGPYFPKEAWTAILAHLRRGNGMIHAGGIPFRIPVRREGKRWVREREQTAYHQQLHIHEALQVSKQRIKRYVHHPEIPLLAGCEHLFEVQDTCGFILHATHHQDQPHELGSGGPMDLHIHPLLKGVAADGRETAAPIVLLEHTKGAFTGGRWLFINLQLTDRFWKEGARLLEEWAAYVQSGVTEWWLKPGYACYEPQERPMLTLQYQALKADRQDESWQVELEVEHEGLSVCRLQQQILVKRQPGRDQVLLPFEAEPGLYEVTAKLTSSRGEVRILRQGFWGMDRQLLAEGSRLVSGRDYFLRDGKPMPIVGMTYMGSDVARKFWFLPNVGIWNRDMSRLKRAGVNLIRTGIWTAWRKIAFIDGHPSEDVLRAIDAFILTARRHGLEVTFTFFSFTPETWEGANPYLDPRSIEAQKRFAAAVVSRHRETKNVHWDLINEPSMFDPRRLFAGPRSCHDPYEHEAYVEWLKQRHGRIEVLQERWNMTPEELPSFEAAELPEPEQINFSVQDVTTRKKGLVWLDYCLFSMEMLNRWIREISGVIRSIQPEQLITVGQDEALPSQRPSPFYYAEAVDYTTVHSWWQMDDLLWDGIFTKDPQKPNLVQETGIMYVENADGRARRTEEELHRILERKYAYAFAVGGAGAVQWIWNTNYYMDNINESNIGALRADGTEKPEADVTYDFGAFMQAIGSKLTDRELEEIVVVYPYANDLSNRRLAVEATTRLTRCLAYEMKVPFRAVGEYQLLRLEQQSVKLFIVPSAHNLSDYAFANLLRETAERGSTLLITGPINLDEYWTLTNRAVQLFGETKLGNVLREELLEIAGKRYPVSFGGQRIADALKELPGNHPSGAPAAVLRAAVGKGTLLWCPLPIELSSRTEGICELYRHALETAGVTSDLIWLEGGGLPGIYGRKLSYSQGSLFVFVSECGCDADVAVRDARTGKSYRFRLPKERSILFFTAEDGSVSAVYRPQETVIQEED